MSYPIRNFVNVGVDTSLVIGGLTSLHGVITVYSAARGRQ